MLLLLLACRAPLVAPPAPFDLADRQVWMASGTPAPHLVAQAPRALSLRAGDLAAAHLPPPGPRLGLPARDASPIAAMAESILGARLDEEPGAVLAERFADLPKIRREWGLAGFGIDVLAGPECESPRVVDDFRWEGDRYTGRYDAGSFLYLANDPEPTIVAMSDRCKDALRANGGDVDAATAGDDPACQDWERYDFFGLDGTEATDPCRACVAVDGDYDRCVDAGQCEDETWGWTWLGTADGGREYWHTLSGYMLGCAPDWFVFVFLLVDDEGTGEVPVPFDHAGWGPFCLPYWDETAGGVLFTCIAGDGDKHAGIAIGEGFNAPVYDLRAEGDDNPEIRPWHARWGLASRVLLDSGIELRWKQMTVPGDGYVSLPMEDGGYGINPYALRPGETDVSDPDNTWAREWYATLTVKHSTTRDGISISPALKNKCPSDRWDGPDAAGRYRCRSPDPTPLEPTSLLDLWDDGASFSYGGHDVWWPLAPVTLATNARPDADVPGGAFVTWVAGSDTEADPDWDACRYPHTFVPDLIELSDVAAPGEDLERHALTGETYRFDKPENTDDILLVVRTNEARGYCPADASGVGWRTVENLP